MTIINISGYEVMIDDEDARRVSAMKWHVNRKNERLYGLQYFENQQVYYDSKGKWKCHTISLHRFIMGCVTGDGKIIDHIDCNSLNNQKENLRFCSVRENSCNQRLSKRNTSGYKGATFNKRERIWYSTIRVKGKTIYLGRFNSPEEAGEAYRMAALEHNGAFARFE